MKRSLIIAFLMYLFGFHAVQADELSFPKTWTEPETSQTLEKMGEYRFVYSIFFKLYDAVLYADAEADAEAILNRTAAFHLEFHYLREIEKEIILKSADRMLEKNLTEAERASISEPVAKLNQVYRTVESGDYSALTYIPGKGTTFRLNGDPKLTIPGKAFAELYFRIWLGEAAPLSPEMRDVLLGRIDE